MSDETPVKTRTHFALQIYQIAAQTILGVVGVISYAYLISTVIFHQGEWTVFQQTQIAGSLGFLAGTIVAGVYGYVFGSSFGSMSKDAQMERNNKP